MIIGGGFAFVMLKNQDNGLASNFANAYGIALTWISIFLVQLPFRLKKVTVDDKGLKIKSDDGNKVIPFKEVYAVSKFELTSPWMVTVKYFDSVSGEKIKIAYMPNQKYQKFMKDDDMTAYLKNESKTNNPAFEESNNLKNLLILFCVGLPFFIAMFYFMSKSGVPPF